jgi:lysophospholipase L1-like esterase
VIDATRGGWLLTGPGGLAETWPAILTADPAPSTIVVAVGINDVMAGVSDASFAAAYRYLVFSALDAGVRVIPALMAPINRRLALYPYAEPRRAALNNWLTAYWGAAAVANFSDMIRVPWGPQLDPVYDYGDGLHPNPYGTMRLADAVPLDRIV